jgi:hypothetical protein
LPCTDTRKPRGCAGQGCRKCSCGAYPGAYLGIGSAPCASTPSWASRCDEALELFVDRQMAELMVENWNRDEPDRAGELYVEPVELETAPN